MRDLVLFVQFKKREKDPWKSVTFSKFADFYPVILPRVTLLRGCFSRFFNYTNGTKPHMQRVTYEKLLTIFEKMSIIDVWQDIK